MNPQETQQVAARVEKWIPFTERVNISSTNVRLETTVPQKEETFQVVFDLIKNSSCFKAFTISAYVLEIFMQQFWYSINKFTDVPNDDTTLAFLIKIGYKEPTRKKTSSKRRVKKKVTLSADNNIISDDPDAALELGKSISKTEDEEAEAARQVHATHARIVTEFAPEPTRRRKSGKVTSDSPKKLKDVPSLTPEEQEVSTVVSVTSSEGTECEYSEEDQLDDEEKDVKEGVADDEGDDHISGIQDTDDEDDETESDKDEIYKYKIRVRKDEDVEMSNAEVEDSDKGDEEVTDAAKADTEKTSEVKDDAKKTELPPTRSSLSVFLDAEINSLLKVKIQSEVPHIQSPSMLRVPVSVISEPSVLTPQIPELPKKQTPTVDLEQESKKNPLEILKIKKEQAEKQKILKFTIKSTNKAALKEYDQKALSTKPCMLTKDENAMDKGVADTVQDHKRKHDDDEDDDEDPLARLNQGKKTKRKRTKESESSKKPSITKENPKGKAPSKGSKTGKSASAKELVEEPTAEVVMDDAGKDVVRDDDQPQDASEPKKTKTLNPYWFTQPLRPPTLDPEWNKRPAYNLLKGTCSSSIKLEYHFQGCFNALTDMLDWNNLKGDCYPFDLSKPFPLQGHPGVKSDSVKKLHGYGHLEEIVVKRADRQFYKFKEEIEFKELYTLSHKPPGVIYEDLTKQNRVMQADELYKFSDGTLKKVRDELHHRIRDFRLEYNMEIPRRKWTDIDRKRSELYGRAD
ncbi:hypothetical protein Tco_0046618 [Tanacetum coccineum]